MVFEETNIKEEINHIFEMMSLRAKMRKIELFYEFDDNLPEKFCTEPRRLK